MLRRLSTRISGMTIAMWLIGLVIMVVVVIGTVRTLASNKYPGDQWITLSIYGLAQGSIYALIALGYTLVYGILRMINFAHSEVFMAGPFVAYFVAVAFDQSGLLDASWVLGLVIIAIIAMLTSVIVAVLLERIAYRPLRRAPRLVPLITAIGASYFLQYAFRGMFGSGVKGYPEIEALKGSLSLVPTVSGLTIAAAIAAVLSVALVAWWLRARSLNVRRVAAGGVGGRGVGGLAIGTIIVIWALFGLLVLFYNMGNTRILTTQALVIAAAILMLAGLYAFVRLTKTGKALQAVSEDKDAAALMGIDVDRSIVITFIIGGALAGAAGVLYALMFRQIKFDMGFFPGLKAFTAAVLGGIGNPVGAMLGGIFLGIAESLFPNLILDGLNVPAPYQLKDALAFVLLVVVLIFRPTGILGERLASTKA